MRSFNKAVGFARYMYIKNFLLILLFLTTCLVVVILINMNAATYKDVQDKYLFGV